MKTVNIANLTFEKLNKRVNVDQKKNYVQNVVICNGQWALLHIAGLQACRLN